MPANSRWDLIRRLRVKGSLPEAPSTEPLEREMPHPQSPFIHLSKSPADEPSSRFPKRSPYEKRCPSPEPFLNILQGPWQGSHPSRFPSQSSHRERHSTSRAPFNHISKSQIKCKSCANISMCQCLLGRTLLCAKFVAALGKIYVEL